MFSHKFEQAPSRLVMFQWLLLSFNGGFINAGGFLATGKFVSHVTGFATLFGVELVNHAFRDALGLLTVPLFFLLGSFLAGLFIDRPLQLGKNPHFDYVMGLCAVCLFTATGGGELLHFGVFGEIIKFKQSYVLMVLLCLACGLQNGAITSSSANTVRTTHLTGLTTDLGLGLARVLTFYQQKKKAERNAHVNRLRAGSILSFVLGSVVGAWIFTYVGYRGFIIPGLIASYIAWHGRNAKVAEYKRIQED
jgi:uncharacterized membrane protein YoaK (UPF0700 family)